MKSALFYPAIFAISTIFSPLLFPTCRAESWRAEPSQRAIEWSVWNGPQKVFTYSFDPAKFKPYVKELCTVNGFNILRDAPPDHLHHHALMYGIRVNGVNFWEETSGSGVEKVVQTAEPQLGNSVAGQSQARLVQVLHWLRPEDAFLPDTAGATLLIERRTLVLTVDPAAEEVALEWTSQFEVGRKTNTVTLTGSNYHGLGMRFPSAFDPVAIHSLEGRVPDLSQSRQEAAAAAWGAVRFDLSEKAATVALSGHSSNARGDATFFAMKTPFAYLSATQGLDKEPLVYHSGDRFTLRYLVLVYPSNYPDAALQSRIRTWRGQP